MNFRPASSTERKHRYSIGQISLHIQRGIWYVIGRCHQTGRIGGRCITDCKSAEINQHLQFIGVD